MMNDCFLTENAAALFLIAIEYVAVSVLFPLPAGYAFISSRI